MAKVTTTYRLGDIQSNPFRNIDNYPINRDKVEALKESINRTEFWDNLVARIGPDGNPEIGYGHHRMVALRELYPEDHQITLITRDLDDEQMLHVMADENMQEWGTSSEIVVETVRAVRDFLNTSGPTRKYSQPGQPPKDNGAAQITTFLGWKPFRVEAALAIIHAEEAGDIKPEDTAGLGIEQATVLRQSVKAIKDPKVKAKAIAQVKKEIAGGSLHKRGIRAAVQGVRDEAKAKRPVLPTDVANTLFVDINGFWGRTMHVPGGQKTRKELVQVIAANRNAAGVRMYVGSIKRALTDMSATNQELLDLLDSKTSVERTA